jgi:peptidoglycan hydrolase-like protein with peptidoglycan-binding domain
MKRLVILATLLSAGALPVSAFAQTADRPTYEQPLNAHAARDVQERLRTLGYYHGRIDGVWGDRTRVALERFQRARGIAATGDLNHDTAIAMGLDPDRLSRGYAARPQEPRYDRDAASVGPDTTRAVQQRLRRLGFYRGSIDGVWGRNTSVALAEFQRRHQLAPTGEPSRDSLVALGLNPDRFLSGSSTPRERGAERLNRRELYRDGN